MTSWLIRRKSFLLWLTISAVLGSWLSFVLVKGEDKRPLLPGITTDGHHQIEMNCNACHINEEEGRFTSQGVSNTGCLNCHAEDLEAHSDSHPVRKFRNPENAGMLEHINALSCITCHREHNQKITGPMAVTVPGDYCAHCHEVTLESLPSHRDLSFKSCATAGCHNYHDNTALAPSFLLKHFGEPITHPEPRITSLTNLRRIAEQTIPTPLRLDQADAPADHDNEKAVHDWHQDAHSKAGVNCRDCHGDQTSGNWNPKPDHTSCNSCHEPEVSTFLEGKHGMRLAHEGLAPMTPAEARRPMKAAAAHKSLNCNSCHPAHNYDRHHASVYACLTCHDDEHSRSYQNSRHFSLWQLERRGAKPTGSGVSCATCHLPKAKIQGEVAVMHNQNWNLAPNDKMLSSVCMKCHGMQFGMDALSDRELIRKNFNGRPTKEHPGISWTVQAAIDRGDEDVIKIKKYLEAVASESEQDIKQK